MTIPCITNITGRNGCRIHGEHLSTCRGIAAEQTGGVYRAVACTGCLPQPATRGLVCESCWLRIQAALDVAVDHITHMRSVERGPIPDGPPVHTAPGSRVIVPTSWLTADESWEVLHELAFRLDPLELLQVRPRGTTAYGFGSRDSIEHVRDRVELAVDLVRNEGLDVVRRDTTAVLAIRYYRQAQRALAAFPIDEDAQPMRYAKCRKCERLTLERRPPLQHLDPIVVKCVNPACGAIWDPAMVEVDLASMRRALEEAVAA